MSITDVSGHLRQIRRFSRENQLTHWWFLLPVLLIYVPFFILPTVALFVLSLYEGSGIDNLEFVGLQNYPDVISDPVTYTAFWNNVQIAIFYEILIFGGSLLLALGIQKAYPSFRQFFQLVFLLPMAMMSVAVAFIWSYIYNPSYGILNHVLAEIPFVDVQPLWLGDPKIALYAIIFVGAWQWIGFNAAIWLAGLENIDERLLEAARIDGANRIQSFVYVTLPLLKPVALFVFILALIGAFKTFAYVYVMTNGGPGHATEVMVTWIYSVAFRQFQMGKAAALSVVLFVVTGVISYLNFKLGERVGGAGGIQ